MPRLCSLNHADNQTQVCDGFWYMGLLPQRICDVFTKRYAPLALIEDTLSKVSRGRVCH
jgi:hypothetical protein